MSDDIRIHDVCGSRVAETALGREGKGPLTQLRCPKCRVLFYVDRDVWKKAIRPRIVDAG